MVNALNLFISNLGIQIILIVLIGLLIPSAYLLVKKKTNANLVGYWFIALLVAGIAIPIIAFMSENFWSQLGLGVLTYILFAFVFTFKVIIKIMPNKSGSGAFVAPIMFAMMATGVMILAHLIFH